MLFCFALQAQAQEHQSYDAELVRLAPGAGTVPGVGRATPLKAGDWSVASLTMFEQNPVLLYTNHEPTGLFVEYRQSTQTGVAMGLGRNVTGRLVLPVVAHWAEPNRVDTHEGLVMGNAHVGLSRGWARAGRSLGLQSRLYLPFGSPEAWVAEPEPRMETGFEASWGGRWVDASLDAGALWRKAIDNDLMTLDDVGFANVALSVRPLSLVQLSGAVYSRTPLTEVQGVFTVFEGMGLVTASIGPQTLVTLGAGRGLTYGAGATQLRALASLQWVPPQRDPEPLAVVAITKLPEAPRLPVEPEPLAQVVDDQIEIREPIQFVLGKDEILPISRPVLTEVALIMQDNSTIGHVVIEGHASEEGSYAYNWALSNARARAIFVALIEAGVHPNRMSFRGMGEVVPRTTQTDEESLASNRRVNFHIVRRYHALEPIPTYADTVTRAWDGQPQPVLNPALPEVPAEPAQERFDVEAFIEELEEEE